MTTREFLNAVITLADSTNEIEIKNKAEGLITALDAKNAKRAEKPSKTAVANEPIKAAILEYFKAADGVHIAADVAADVNITPQKASALLRQMVESGILKAEEVKVPKKGKVKGYSLAQLIKLKIVNSQQIVNSLQRGEFLPSFLFYLMMENFSSARAGAKYFQQKSLKKGLTNKGRWFIISV